MLVDVRSRPRPRWDCGRCPTTSRGGRRFRSEFVTDVWHGVQHGDSRELVAQEVRRCPGGRPSNPAGRRWLGLGARGTSMTPSGAGCDPSTPGSTLPGAAKAAPPGHGANARSTIAESKASPRDIRSRFPSEIHGKYPALRGGPRDAVPASRLHRLPTGRRWGVRGARGKTVRHPPATEGEPVHAWRRKLLQRLCPPFGAVLQLYRIASVGGGFGMSDVRIIAVSLEGGERLEHITHVWTADGAMPKQRAVEDMWSGTAPLLRRPADLPGRCRAGAGARAQPRHRVLRPSPPGRPRVAPRREHEGQSADASPAPPSPTRPRRSRAMANLSPA